MIGFIVGLLIGCFGGVLIAALMAAAGRDDR